jgi:hypothetical protein
MRFHLLRPIDALHDYWRQSSPEAHIVVGASGFGAWIAHVDWATVIAFGGFAISTIVGTVMQLCKQWQLIQIEIEQRKREAREAAPTLNGDCRPDRQAGGFRPNSPGAP